MRYFFVFFSVLMLFYGCKKGNLNLSQEKAAETLAEYGKANPENKVVLDTEFGKITIQLYEDTPYHRANFVRLIKNNYYKWGVFYRVVSGLLVQGGDPNVARRVDFTVPNEMKNNHLSA
jgi:Cyclophilin type peptidyl-prolyl cis-trans isomerase/CLD